MTSANLQLVQFNYVIKQLVHALDIEHLGSLESTQEARVALSCASCNSYASFMAIRMLTHELIIVKSPMRMD